MGLRGTARGAPLSQGTNCSLILWRHFNVDLSFYNYTIGMATFRAKMGQGLGYNQYADYLE